MALDTGLAGLKISHAKPPRRKEANSRLGSLSFRFVDQGPDSGDVGFGCADVSDGEAEDESAVQDGVGEEG